MLLKITIKWLRRKMVLLCPDRISNRLPRQLDRVPSSWTDNGKSWDFSLCVFTFFTRGNLRPIGVLEMNRSWQGLSELNTE